MIISITSRRGVSEYHHHHHSFIHRSPDKTHQLEQQVAVTAADVEHARPSIGRMVHHPLDHLVRARLAEPTGEIGLDQVVVVVVVVVVDVVGSR